MIEIKASLAAASIKQALEQEQKQLPFAMALTLSRVGKKVKQKLQDSMPHYIDRPTRWTLNSLFLKPATKKDLEATVWLKDEAPKGNPASKYLAQLIYGRARTEKRFEKLLFRRPRNTGGLTHTVPGKGVKLNAYGNVTQGTIGKILSATKSQLELGSTSNQTTASRIRNKKALTNVFVGKPRGGNRTPGVYQRVGKGTGRRIKPLLIFVKQPKYKKQWPFFAIGEKVASYSINSEFNKAFQEATASAR